MSESPQTRRPFRRIVLGGVVLIHAIVYWLVVFELWLVDVHGRVIAVGALLGQCSLVAIGAMRFVTAFPVRIALSWSAALACWYGISTIFFWGLGEPGAAWWAIAITVQTIVCTVGMEVVERRVKPFCGSSVIATESRTTPLQFPIRSLIVVTTMAAIWFAVVDFGQRRGWWSTDSLNVTESILMAGIGLTIGVTALSCVIALASRQSRVIAGRLVVVAAIVVILAILVNWGAVQAGMDQSADPSLTIMLLGTEAVCILITLTIVDRVSGAR
ncbi:MAG: hypothetical protein F9B45_19095 [Phycisphaera sp. RhM]|nr:hypothetical protein [Phycisphaera sp. RhM]